jgi:hypothetical protein
LERAQVAATYQGIDLGVRGAQEFSHVG